MADILIIDIPDLSETIAEPVEVIYTNVQTLDPAENTLVAVAYPGDWLTVYGDGNDGE